MLCVGVCVFGVTALLCWYLSAVALKAACTFLAVDIDMTQSGLMVLLQTITSRALSFCGVQLLRRQYAPATVPIEIVLPLGGGLFIMGLMISAFLFTRFLEGVTFRRGLLIAVLEMVISLILLTVLISPLYFLAVVGDS